MDNEGFWAEVVKLKINEIECKAENGYMMKWDANASFVKEVMWLSKSMGEDTTELSRALDLASGYTQHLHAVVKATIASVRLKKMTLELKQVQEDLT